MYICPTCKKGFETENQVVKHFSICWREQNPNHVSKEAPHSPDIVTSNINDEVLNFFNSFSTR